MNKNFDFNYELFILLLKPLYSYLKYFLIPPNYNIYSAILPSKCFIILPFTHVYNNCESVLVFGMRITCFFTWIYNYAAFFWEVSIEFVTILLLFHVLFFWPHGMQDLSSLTRYGTCTPCIGRLSLNHLIIKEVPIMQL